MIVDGFKFSWEHIITKKKKAVKRYTYCIMRTTEDLMVTEGVAICNLEEDQYNKEVGRRKALRDLLFPENLPTKFPREFRTKVWEAYRTLTKVPRWEVKVKNREVRRKEEVHHV